MVLGQRLWEGKGKFGVGLIKSVEKDGVSSEYSWNAQLKGLGCAEGLDCTVHVTAMTTQPPKGIGTANDQGVLMTIGGDMAVLKGQGLSKMVEGKPSGVALWYFMTMSEKLNWMNEMIALATLEATDPMWQEFNIIIYEWK